MEILLVFIAIAVVSGLVLLIGRALGDPQPKPQLRKFDETPADVAALDVSDGTPLDHDDLDITKPRQMSQEQATTQFERLRVQIEAERRL